MANLQQIYVRKTGNDATGNGASTNPFLTIAKAMSLVMSNHRAKEIIIDGDYSDEEVELIKAIGLSVTVVGINDAKVKAIFFTNYRAAKITFSKLTTVGTTARGGYESSVTNGYNYASPDSRIYFINCTINGIKNASGIFVQGGSNNVNNIFVDGCTINNTARAIATNGGYIISKNNKGEGNTASLSSAWNGYIKQIGTQPDGIHHTGEGGKIE